MADWDAEVVVDQELVRALLTEQFPELDSSSTRLLGEGWDNSVWLVEEQWAFRFPRREIAVPGLEREINVLPRLAPLLPAPIPVPTHAGRPSDRYPWPFFGARLLPGLEPAEAELNDADRVALGADLGRFLRALHDVELDLELPHDPLGRADMAVRVPRARACLEDVESAGVWKPPSLAGEVLVDALTLSPPGAGCVVHGDLHARHALVKNGRLAAVIDWGDACVGDPSMDLQLAWSLLPPSGRVAFVEAYGPILDDRLLRARATALYFGAMLAAYALSVGNDALRRECVDGLERTLVDFE